MHVHICIYICIYTYTNLHVCMYVCMCIYIFIFIFVHVCIVVHIRHMQYTHTIHIFRMFALPTLPWTTYEPILCPGKFYVGASAFSACSKRDSRAGLGIYGPGLLGFQGSILLQFQVLEDWGCPRILACQYLLKPQAPAKARSLSQPSASVNPKPQPWTSKFLNPNAQLTGRFPGPGHTSDRRVMGRSRRWGLGPGVFGAFRTFAFAALVSRA